MHDDQKEDNNIEGITLSRKPPRSSLFTLVAVFIVLILHLILSFRLPFHFTRPVVYCLVAHLSFNGQALPPAPISVFGPASDISGLLSWFFIMSPFLARCLMWKGRGIQLGSLLRPLVVVCWFCRYLAGKVLVDGFFSSMTICIVVFTALSPQHLTHSYRTCRMAHCVAFIVAPPRRFFFLPRRSRSIGACPFE